jgi:hypothetical protein
MYGVAITVFALIVLLPNAATAQEPARIRATARVVGSVLSETRTATAIQLESLAELDGEGAMQVHATLMSSNGYAHVFAERLSEPSYEKQIRGIDPIHSVDDREQEVLHITVAYTAN